VSRAPVASGASATWILPARELQVIQQPFEQPFLTRFQFIGAGGGHLLIPDRTNRVDHSFVAGDSVALCPASDCTCPNGRPLPYGARRVPNVPPILALISGAEASLEVRVTSMTREQACNDTPPTAEPPPVPGAVDPCIVGDWTLDAGSYIPRFMTSNPTFQEHHVSLTRARMTLQIQGSGAITMTAQEFAARGPLPLGGRVTVTMTGSFTGRVGTAGDQLIARGTRPATVSGRYVLDIAGQHRDEPLPANMTAAVEQALGANGRYACVRSPALLLLTAPNGVQMRFTR
jgi:hypothetical protein